MADLITALKVGSSYISAATARLNSDKSLEIIAYADEKTQGFAQGNISDFKKFIKSIKNVVNSLEHKLGFKLNYSYVGLSGPHITSIPTHGSITLTSRKEVDSEDISKVIENSKVVSLPTGKGVLHVIPGTFILDGAKGIKNPYGMSGTLLEVNTNILLANVNTLFNYRKAIMEAGLEVEQNRGFVFNGLASSLAVLNQEEKESGVLFIDIGTFTTDFLIYYRNDLIYAGCIPLGSGYITNDIRVMLKTSWAEAERLKFEEVDLSIDYFDSLDKLEFLPYYSDNNETIERRYFIENVINPRVEEILERVNFELERVFGENNPLVGVVLTGGGSLLKGIDKKAKEIYKLPVAIKKHNNYVKVPEQLNKENYSALIGLLIYAKNIKEHEKVEKENMKLEKNGLFSKLHKMIARLFF